MIGWKKFGRYWKAGFFFTLVSSGVHAYNDIFKRG